MTDAADQDSTDMDENILRGYIAECSNWGRWGADDQAGTWNLVGPDQINHAASLVKQGKSISLSLPYDQKGPQIGLSGRFNPILFASLSGTDVAAGQQDLVAMGISPRPGMGFSDHTVIMPTQSGTQWDCLNHVFWEGKMYNDRPAAGVSATGSSHNSAEHVADRGVARGVLADIARHKGVDSLDPGYAITSDDIEGALDSKGIEILPGDAVLVRTGFLGARRGNWGDYVGGDAPGISLHAAPWVHRSDIAALATDTWGMEVRPNEIGYFQPLHAVLLVHTGLAIGEIFDLEALADDCARDGVYEFMLVAPHLPITGASGTPVGALALK
ncbi:cyclase family protein [Mycobacteroides salmoniphilum]|uniref:Cyclase n=1 Tax=Mycobacteroides salmoniphilum TaxID=404941 RepID=A0A4R8SHI3_9MYCO|nr:cyclase family protein [Mycobacteroides salmoniphilum]TDZ96391.1 putative cyclase [Mycobacteroides salmoniphilum]TEA05486.1 putative cyclase [Mycobacteroides salmoniphilum]